jgi:hypothetical protein
MVGVVRPEQATRQGRSGPVAVVRAGDALTEEGGALLMVPAAASRAAGEGYTPSTNNATTETIMTAADNTGVSTGIGEVDGRGRLNMAAIAVR